MGAGGSKIEFRDLGCNKYPVRQEPIKFNNLKYIRCAFLTQEQYTNEYHIPKNSLNISFNTTMDNIENSIDINIQNVYNKLNEIRSPTPIKILKPIFVAFSRKIEHINNVLNDKSIRPIEIKKENDDISYCLAINKYINSYLNKMKNNDLINKYNSLPINKYDFKGNVKVIIFFPFITTDYKYITNFKDILNSSAYFINLLSDTEFNGIPETSSFDEEKFRKSFSKSGFSKKFVDKIINDIKLQDKTNYRYRDDLMVLCNEGGCLSESGGEDFNSLLPRISDNNGDNTNNALNASPFLPTKCLAQTNRYKCGILSPDNNNKTPQELIKDNDVMNYLTDILQKYIINEECITENNKNKDFCNRYADKNPDLQQTPVDIINNVISVFLRKEKYSSDFNNNKKNHYSEIYSINIIKELMFINNIYPGIPEVVFPLYLYTKNNEYTIEPPWGARLLTTDYIFNDGEEIPIGVRKYSSNNRYYIEMNSQGQIYVSTNENIYYYLNIHPFKKPVSMIFTNTITINFIEEETNYLRPRRVINMDLIMKDDKHRDPYSFYINDEGKIRVISNGFLDATSKEFNDFIDNKINEYKKYKNNLNYYNSKSFDSNNNIILSNVVDKQDPPLYLYK